MARALRCFAALIVAPLSVVVVGAGIADAGLGVGATPTFPAVVTVGNTGLAATIQLVNNNTAPDTAGTVCNSGDPLPCPVGDPGITLIPSCGQIGPFSACTIADPGVFQLSATGVGQPNTVCAGTTFTITLIDPATGRLRFTPQPPGTHVVLPVPGSMCQVNFTFDVLKTPIVDQNPGAPGIQTVQVVDFTESAGTTASARGTSIGTRVEKATPAINTVASTNVVLGGALTDQAEVTGRVNPQPGATVDFRLYGPGDSTCTGSPVFETLGVAYPVGGGLVSSMAFTPPSPGTYLWVATYNGDTNNNAVAGTCGAAGETSVVSRATPTITTIASVSVVLGGSLTDQVTVTGRVNPQPGATVDFRLYGPDDATCSGVPVFETLGVPYPVADAPVTSSAFTPPSPGTYLWVATYNGDVNNAAVSGTCGAEGETAIVAPPPASLARVPPTFVPGSSLPATGADHGLLLRLALGLSVTGLLLVASTIAPRRQRGKVPAPVN